jgi:hypothetical protein
MRRAVVLCELQGRTRQQAAKELRISEGTLSSRLARARKLLRDRLVNRGFGLVAPGTVLVSAKLTAATAGLVNGPAGVVPAAVWALSQEAMKAMTISKLKLGAVLTAVAVGLSGFGLTASGGDEKAKTDPPMKPAAAPAEQAEKKWEFTMRWGETTAVATIHGQSVSREEFAEHLIRKYGAKEIGAFVNKKIIEAEVKKRGVSVSAEELEAGFQTDCKNAGVTPADFVKVVLPKYGKTETEWREDVLRPRLLLEKLCRGDVTATVEGLKELFERKYGEKRRVQVAQWQKDLDPKKVAEQYDLAKRNPFTFDAYTIRVQTFGQPESTALTFEKGAETFGVKAVNDAAFALTKSDEVSDLIEGQHGWYAVKLVEVVPARKDKTFEDEKAALMTEAMQNQMHVVISQHFAKLKADAKPVYHIQPEPKMYAQPLPVKK